VISHVSDDSIKTVWRTPISRGYSGPSVIGNRVFVTDFVRQTGTINNISSAKEKVAGHERVLCLDATNGKILWIHSYPVEYEVSYPGGPRTSPAISDDKVYTLGTDGDPYCLKAESGEVIWQKRFSEDYGADTPFWGHSAHPLVFDDTIVCMVGGKNAVVVAFDLNTGAERWTALTSKEPGYAPPTLAHFAGKPTLLVWHPESLNGLNPKDGSLRWSIALPANYGMSVTAPLVSGHRIYVSGIGTPPTLIHVSENGEAAEMAWQGGNRKGIVTGNSTPVIYDGVIYGVDTQGRLIASSLFDGEQLWSTYKATTGSRRQSYFTAFLVRNEDRFFIFNENGSLVLAELSENGYTELGRRSILNPTNDAYGRKVIWSHPAFAQLSLFARNDKEIVRVSLAETNGNR